MKTPRQKIVVIYHGDCSDGFGGAWAAWKKFGARAAYIPAYDRATLPCQLKNKEVYLVDYTYQPDVVKKLMKDNIRVTAIDHHVSAMASVKLTQNYSYDIKHSGAVLAWNYFHPGGNVPMLLRVVEDRDIWKWNVPHSRELLMMIDLAPFDFKIWNRLAKDLENPRIYATYVKKGELLLFHYRSLWEKLLRNAELVKFDGKKIFALNCPRYFADDCGHALAIKTNSFALLWSESDGVINVSLRSNGKIDVSKIAKKYGGGGHKYSSGFLFKVGAKTPWKILPIK
jgi:oligoribonuclease NrnB/cAMP/cGMP phosphodiesterase (DHH superfamily)